MADGSGFLEELKRRHVWRVAIAYVVTAWLLLQLASIVLPTFGTPDWVLKALIVIFVIFFPLAILLAWAFEITPEGIRRTAPADSPGARETSHTRSVGRKLNTVITAVLVIAVALLLANTFIWHKGMRGAAVASGSGATAKSIAVLPFQNLSSDKNNAYFADGIQDLILTKLADIGDLKVISRTSTMQYGSHPGNLKTVGQQLGVATILEGSVQKQGDQVLINVQLINVKTDNHIWAETYTRTLDNVFGVEGEVAEKIASALNAKLSPAQSAQLAAAPTTNQAAYDLFLRAEYQSTRGDVDYDTASWKAAIPLYRQAISHDQNFALAWARLSYAESMLAWFGGGGEDVKQLNQHARADAEQALKLAPNQPASQLALGYSDYYGKGDYAAALKAFDAALVLRPNDANALAARGYVERRQGRFDAAIASLKQALAHDPRNSALANEVGRTCMQVSRYAEAETWLQRALALDPDNLNAKSYYSHVILLNTGDVTRALAAAQGDAPILKKGRVTLLIYQRKYPAAIAMLESIPDTPDNFRHGGGGSKALQMAKLYRLAGDATKAEPLFEQALPEARAQLAHPYQFYLAFVWTSIADAELGLGHTAKALDAIARSQMIAEKIEDHDYGPPLMYGNAGLYAEAERPDLAVPLLAKALATPGIGTSYSPVLLWLDPAWDPIRHDSRFQALLKKYAKYKPAVTYDTTPAAGATSTK